MSNKVLQRNLDFERTPYYIGIMSGTSLDGVDAVLIDFAAQPPILLGQASATYPLDMKHAVLALQNKGYDELHQSALLAQDLAYLYAAAVAQLLQTTGVPASAVCAIGNHGQTIRHNPQDAYTLQIGNHALLAELTGIAVVGDFRSRDIAAGGQGAPLVPAFHHAMFFNAQRASVILNIGGIANLTYLSALGILGFDTGPGNMLLDAWIMRHLGQAYDADGVWAAQGVCHAGLLAHLLSEAYFSLPAPKTTGRDLFNLAWLDAQLLAFPSVSAVDVQATLLALTAQTIAQAVQAYCADARGVYVCGGGVRNHALMRALAVLLPDCVIEPTDVLGVPSQAMEAFAFAWLAKQTMMGQAGNLPSATGARGPRVLGAVYPA